MSNTVAAKMNFLSASYAGEPVRHLDQRAPTGVATTFAVMNAHEHTDPRLHATGFELVNSPSAVTDFYDCDLVIGTYYNECKAIAKNSREPMRRLPTTTFGIAVPPQPSARCAIVTTMCGVTKPRMGELAESCPANGRHVGSLSRRPVHCAAHRTWFCRPRHPIPD